MPKAKHMIKKVCLFDEAALDKENWLFFSPQYHDIFEKVVLQYYKERGMYFVPSDDFIAFLNSKFDIDF